MKKFLLATAAILMTNSVYAADAIVDEVPVAIEVDGFSWSGFYAGIHGGYSWSDADFESPLAPGIAWENEGDLDGFLVGLHTGINHQFDNNVVLGMELDIDYRDGDDSATFSILGTPTPGLTLDTELNWSASARLRAGYAMDRWLPYVTGGFAIADYDSTFLINGVPFPAAGGDFSDTSVGYTIGGGAEYAFTDNLIFRGEYRYSNFGEEDNPFALNPVGGSTFEIDSHDITFGVSVKF
jgi:outer membrane immunogenic protein